MLAQTKTDKALDASDPGGGLVAILVGMAGSLGLLTKYNISADEFAQFVCYAFAGAAALRAYLEKGRRSRYMDDVAELLKQHGVEGVEDVRVALAALRGQPAPTAPAAEATSED